MENIFLLLGILQVLVPIGIYFYSASKQSKN